ncbi:MAG: M48 family metallopeptidase [Pseudomonadota bacterium]
MNFFSAQDQARRATRRLVILYILAAALIVAGVAFTVGIGLWMASSSQGYQPLFGYIGNNTTLLLGVALLTMLIIVGATMYKVSHLSSGGGRVAQDLGGTLVPPDTTDPLQQRLRNVVEEMSIASGVPVPEVYVLEREAGINAFAAGYTPGDAAVAVTRGALELLDRDELQGVIAHEYSHILNGDMRINIRLMGILFGIMVLGLMGRIILRGTRHSSSSRNRGNGVAVALVVGVGLVLLGWIGVFFARLIKSGVSRQREYLADASAVQFTRQTRGLAGALKKIGGFQHGSRITSADPEEVSHMLFGSGSKLAGMFATHPPLGERIRALDPDFEDGDYPQVTLKDRFQGREGDSDPRSAGIAGAATVSPADIVESAGQPTEQHVAFAQAIRSSIPETLYDAAHSSELAYLLTIALVLDPTGKSTPRQLDFVGDQLGAQRRNVVESFVRELESTPLDYRLPLLETCFPALRRRPPPQLEYLIDLTAKLIDLDSDLAIYEFCFYRILASNLHHVIDPSAKGRRVKASKKVVRDAAVQLMQIIARYGQEDGEAAFHAGLDSFGKWRQDYQYDAHASISARSLDDNLNILVALNGAGRRMLLEAITRVVSHDDRLTVEEAGLVRVVCASLEIPLPPQIGVS